MYGGQSVQYGWHQGRPVSGSNIVELPLAPVRRRSSGGSCHGCMNWHSFGIILSLMAAATLSLGIADVVITYQNYMMNKNCKDMTTPAYCDPNTLIWTWIGVGIWSSLPVFIFGIMAIRRGGKPFSKSSWFEFFAFLSAFIFTPAMVVISAIEVYKGSNVYYWNYMAPLTSDDLAKAIIPIVIAGVGFIEHAMTFIAICYICCCHAKGPEVVYGTTKIGYAGQPAAIYPTYDRPVYGAAPRTQVACQQDCRTNQPAFPGSFYSSSSGFAPRPTTYNYFSNMGASAQQGGFRSPPPNQAYNFFRS